MKKLRNLLLFLLRLKVCTKVISFSKNPDIPATTDDTIRIRILQFRGFHVTAG
jgi:hypothetical protein